MKLTDFKFAVSPKYLLALSKFAAKGDIRYYLNGFNVKPHPDKGVILSACNGHMLVTIYDECGFSDGEYILPLNAKLVAATKPPSRASRKLWPRTLLFTGNQLLVSTIDFDDDFDFSLSQSNINYSEYAEPIEGKFPELGRVLANKTQTKVDHLCFNPEYLGLLKYCSDRKGLEVVFYTLGDNEPLIAISGSSKQFVTAIMPMRKDLGCEKLKLPSHANALIAEYFGMAENKAKKVA